MHMRRARKKCLHPLDLSVSISLYFNLELLGVECQAIGYDRFDEPSCGGKQCAAAAYGCNERGNDLLPVDGHRLNLRCQLKYKPGRKTFPVVFADAGRDLFYAGTARDL